MFAPLLRKTDKEYIDNSGISLQKPENKIDWVKLFIKLLYIYILCIQFQILLKEKYIWNLTYLSTSIL